MRRERECGGRGGEEGEGVFEEMKGGKWGELEGEENRVEDESCFSVFIFQQTLTHVNELT